MGDARHQRNVTRASCPWRLYSAASSAARKSDRVSDNFKGSLTRLLVASRVPENRHARAGSAVLQGVLPPAWSKDLTISVAHEDDLPRHRHLPNPHKLLRQRLRARKQKLMILAIV